MEKPYRYYKGRPAIVRQRKLRTLLLWFLPGMIAVSLFIYGFTISDGWHEVLVLKSGLQFRPMLKLAIDLLVPVGYGVILLRSFLGYLKDHGRIVPYFKKPAYLAVPGFFAALRIGLQGTIDTNCKFKAETFGLGEALAAHCEALDALAIERNLPPISSFGFNDDDCGEAVEWHDAAKGLVMVKGLIAAIEQGAVSWPENDRKLVLFTLEKCQQALRVAEQEGVPFCLQVQTRNAMPGDDWARPTEYYHRQGTFAEIYAEKSEDGASG